MKYSSLFLPILLCLSACGGGASSESPVTINPTLDSKLTLLSTFSSAQMIWPSGSLSGGGKGAAIDNVNCLKNEDYHIHVHLSIFNNQFPIQIPAQVGLTGCAYELHTHDTTGVIHVETSIYKKFNLGQFFSVWGLEVGENNIGELKGQVSVYINDNGNLQKWNGNLKDIELLSHREITIFIGSPSSIIPTVSWTAGL